MQLMCWRGPGGKRLYRRRKLRGRQSLAPQLCHNHRDGPLAPTSCVPHGSTPSALSVEGLDVIAATLKRILPIDSPCLLANPGVARVEPDIELHIVDHTTTSGDAALKYTWA